MRQDDKPKYDDLSILEYCHFKINIIFANQIQEFTNVYIHDPKRQFAKSMGSQPPKRPNPATPKKAQPHNPLLGGCGVGPFGGWRGWGFSAVAGSSVYSL